MENNLKYVELQLVAVHCLWGFVSKEDNIYSHNGISHAPHGNQKR